MSEGRVPAPLRTALGDHPRLDVVGEGSRPIIFLHGFLGSRRNLRTLAQRLVALDATLCAYLIDLPGHGRAPPLPEGASLHDVALELDEFVDAVGVARPLTIVGHSLGGLVALALSEARQKACAHVVLLDIAPGPLAIRHAHEIILEALLSAPRSASTRDEMRRFLRAPIDRASIIPVPVPVPAAAAGPPSTGGSSEAAAMLPASTIEWLLTSLERKGDHFEWIFDRRALAEFRARIAGVDLWPALEHGGLRIDCIRGGASDFVTEADVVRMRRAGATVSTIEHAGHSLHIDATDDVARAISSCLDVRS